MVQADALVSPLPGEVAKQPICSDSSSVCTLQVRPSLILLLVETVTIFGDISFPKMTPLFWAFAALGFQLVPLKLTICHVSITSHQSLQADGTPLHLYTHVLHSGRMLGTCHVTLAIAV